MKEDRKTYEKRVVRLMITMYCNDTHGTPKGSLCPECSELADYADRRVDACRRGAEKTFCSNCHTPCYKPAMREKIRIAMRHSGPRMIFHCPVLAIKHVIMDMREKKRMKKAGGSE
ncbi:MAG: nitrous oxide-stimulated promoter family protein [Coriobacteriaceae bacterium]|nr:nitrous oxide-stimulated promoter family protein [Coriobacteriaceae bacterium]MDD7112714.1 nitrous oxide-stimulated promoter family protein [Coriobacteriaceae bacterium]MDY5810084.1 nitrous oxide-stimulated promoter family protein [Coriobacteriales bacterium]